MHMHGTLLLILISAKNIDVVELSHRGEVREIKEFEVIEKPVQSSENILADSNGQIYRIQHCKYLGQDDGKKLCAEVTEIKKD